MPIIFLIIGALLIAAALNDKTSELGTLVKGDFTGQGNFLMFALALLIIGALGYVKPLKPISVAFLTLVIIVMVLANDKGKSGGFFSKFMQALNLPSSGASSGSSTGLNIQGLPFSFSGSNPATSGTLPDTSGTNITDLTFGS